MTHKYIFHVINFDAKLECRKFRAPTVHTAVYSLASIVELLSEVLSMVKSGVHATSWVNLAMTGQHFHNLVSSQEAEGFRCSRLV